MTKFAAYNRRLNRQAELAEEKALFSSRPPARGKKAKLLRAIGDEESLAESLRNQLARLDPEKPYTERVRGWLADKEASIADMQARLAACS